MYPKSTVYNQPDQSTHHSLSIRQLCRLPPELHTEILFHSVFTNSDNEDEDMAGVIKNDITPYILASREALQCWLGSRHLILHRVATIQLASTEAY
jgi:hypothetical protein